MKKKPVNKKFKKLVMEAATKYLNILGFSHYDLTIRYLEKDIASDDPRDDVVAQCTVDRRYLSAVIKIYPCMEHKWLKEKDDMFVHKTVAHEVAHIATAHMWHMCTSIYKDEGESVDAWESLTTVVGDLLYRHK